MTRVHIVSVGGSHQPLLTSIKAQKADRVVFFCSRKSRDTVNGPGKPCEVWKDGKCVEKLANLVTLANLPSNTFDVWEVDDPDDLSACYECLSRGLAGLNCTEPVDVTADYTGGTKTMSAALVVAAIDFNAKLVITTGPRVDLVRVRQGQITERAETSQMHLRRFFKEVLPRRLTSFAFSAANDDLSSVLMESNPTPEQKKSLRALVNWMRALEQWDRFEHSSALELLEPYRKFSGVRVACETLTKIISSREVLEEAGERFEARRLRDYHGYEALEDLVLNAQRRREQHCFDDAVGRLYRAVELLAQLTLLLRHGVRTGAVLPDQVPESFRTRIDFEGGKAKLGLMASYELLMALGDETVGRLFSQRKGALQDSLQVRNLSILAHGFNPIDESRFHRFASVVEGFILEALKLVSGRGEAYELPPQLPRAVPEELSLFGP